VYDLVVDANQRDFGKATPAVSNPLLPLPGLSPVGAKKIVAQFDGGLLSSDAGVLVLREIEQRRPMRVRSAQHWASRGHRAMSNRSARHFVSVPRAFYLRFCVRGILDAD
jgi:hypothetical protein